MAYIKRNFVNSPLTTTPINATNLNAMDTAIYNNDIGVNTGWNLLNATLTYASADAPTFVMNTSVDLTSIISIGMKLKLTQTTVKYFIVTAISATTITVYGGTDYTLLNAAITLPHFSVVKAPYGFPICCEKWTEKFVATSDFNQASPVQNTWYNAYSKSIPIGAWKLGYSGAIAVTSTASQASIRVSSTLSTTNNSETDVQLSCYSGLQGASGTLLIIENVNIDREILLSSKTTYYFNARTISTNIASLVTSYTNQPVIIKAVCNYL